MIILYSEPNIRGRHDVRTRRERYQRAHAAWEEQLPALVDSYLTWKHSSAQEVQDPTVSNHDEDTTFHVGVVGTTGMSQMTMNSRSRLYRLYIILSCSATCQRTS